MIREACDAEVWPDPLPPPAGVLLAKLADIEGLVSLLTDKIDGDLLDKAPRLKVISNFAVGFNNIDVPACTQRGIAVGNTPGVLTDATADMAFCLLIAAARRVVEGHQYTLAGQWKTWEPLGHLVARTWQGMHARRHRHGRIGYAAGQALRFGWDMRVLYHDLYQSQKAETDLGAHAQVDLDTILRESDFLSLHADLNDTTRDIINAGSLKKMKRTAVLINSARPASSIRQPWQTRA